MSDLHDYTVTEFILCGLFVGGALSFLVASGMSLAQDRWFTSVEWAGLGLLLLGGSVDPKKYIVDYVTFPFTFHESAGRDTPITMIAAGLGTSLWLVGLLGNWLS